MLLMFGIQAIREVWPLHLFKQRNKMSRVKTRRRKEEIKRNEKRIEIDNGY